MDNTTKLIIFFICSLQTYIPLTDTYIKLNFLINKYNRERVVQMYKSDQLKNYKTGLDKFVLPLKYRLTSHTGRIYIKSTNGETKMLFFVHGGINSSVIIYDSENGDINNGDFGFRYQDIKPLEKHWYSAILLKKDN